MGRNQKKGGGQPLSGGSGPKKQYYDGGSNAPGSDDGSLDLDLTTTTTTPDDSQHNNSHNHLLDFSWTEIVQGCASVLLCAWVSVMVGVAAGIAISIQHMDVDDALLLMTGSSSESSPSNSDSSNAAAPPQLLFHHPRITIWDPLIASHSPLASGSDPMMIDGSRISNKERILSLVEESPPLLSAETVTDDSQGGGDGGSVNVTNNNFYYDQLPAIDPPVSSFEQFSKGKLQKKLCSDGKTYGFDRWDTLIEAFQEANAYSADRFMRWNKFFASTKGTFDGTFADPLHYYEEDIVITICPNAVIRGKRGPLAFINAENIVLQCEEPPGCTIAIQQGSHFSFGPHAKNILFRGVSFTGATTSSLLFHFDGADVSLEDCFFEENVGASRSLGTVADVNSTSVVNFYRCLMKNGPSDRLSGLTSLSIRARDTEL